MQVQPTPSPSHANVIEGVLIAQGSTSVVPVMQEHSRWRSRRAWCNRHCSRYMEMQSVVTTLCATRCGRRRPNVINFALVNVALKRGCLARLKRVVSNLVWATYHPARHHTYLFVYPKEATEYPKDLVFSFLLDKQVRMALCRVTTYVLSWSSL